MTHPCASMTNEELVRFVGQLQGRTQLEDLLKDRLIDAERMLNIAQKLLEHAELLLTARTYIDELVSGNVPPREKMS